MTIMPNNSEKVKKKGEDETISIRVTVRGNKKLWIDFVNEVRKRKKETKKNVWETLEEWIKIYLNRT